MARCVSGTVTVTRRKKCLRSNMNRWNVCPILVIYPENEEQVAQLIETAKAHNVCLIPYGGGTNVTDALRCETGENRFIVSVDMSRMNRILWIDSENRMACIEAGAVGRNIAAQLKEYGFTMVTNPTASNFQPWAGGLPLTPAV